MMPDGASQRHSKVSSGPLRLIVLASGGQSDESTKARSQDAQNMRPPVERQLNCRCLQLLGLFRGLPMPLLETASSAGTGGSPWPRALSLVSLQPGARMTGLNFALALATPTIH